MMNDVIVDVNNFIDFTEEEYRENLNRLGATSHKSMVGSNVYYSKRVYGLHRIIKWDPDRAEFLLDLYGDRFWSNPFRIFR